MTFRLNEVVPWGRSFDEYVAMFAMSEDDLLGKRILGCGDGSAAFNAGLTGRGGKVVSADPMYKFSVDEIRRRIDVAYPIVIEQTRKNSNEFVWRHIRSIEELGRVRMAAMEEFLSDYPSGLTEGRYIEASLPGLPFDDAEFDLALCSHLLFLYSEHLSEDFHVASIRELCRVADEVRIFPLLELGAKRSRHLESVLARLRKEGFLADIEAVAYEFQKGGNEMLRVTAI
jgi:SAM-dependent methyltransferase